MSVAPFLREGIEAYRKGAFDEAAAAFARAEPDADQEASLLLAALAAVASAAADASLESIPAKRFELLSRSSHGLDIGHLRRQLDAGQRRPELRDARRLSTRALVRFGLLLLVVAAGFLALRFTPLAELADREHVVGFLEGLRGAWWSPLVIVALYAFFSPIGLPATPLIAAGGIVFGVWAGSLVNFVGVLAGAATSYWLARLLGQELVEQVVGDKLRKVENLVERHGFWTLARLRFVPIPFGLFNFSCALGGVRFPLFMASSATGMAPTTVIWTYFWTAMTHVAAGQKVPGVYRNLGLAMGGVFLLTFLPRILRGLWRRRRLAQLQRSRQRDTAR